MSQMQLAPYQKMVGLYAIRPEELPEMRRRGRLIKGKGMNQREGNGHYAHGNSKLGSGADNLRVES